MATQSTEIFWGIPQFVWNGLFEIIRMIVVGLILGVFATRYQKRKEIELQIKGKILTRRIEILEDIEKIISELYNKIAPPLREEALAADILDCTNLQVEHVEYPHLFNSEETFDDYYKRFHVVARSSHNYMTYQMERLLSEFSMYLTELKCLLDAFCDTEHNNYWKFPERVIKSHIILAYKIVGAALQQDIDGYYCRIDRQVAREMKKIELTYGHNHWRKVYWDRKQQFFGWVESHMLKQNLLGWICKKIYFGYLYRNYGHSRLITMPEYVKLILMYVHYSEKYTPESFSQQSDEKIKQLIGDFESIYVSNYHI